MALAPPRFFRAEFRDTWVNIAPMLVVAIGMTLVIVARQIDISVGSQFSVCAVIAGLLAQTGMPLPIVILTTIAVGMAMAAINGALVAGLGLPSIVVTLATMVIFRQSPTWARQGAMVANLPARFQWFGQSQTTGEWLLVSISIAIFIAFVCAAGWLSTGRKVYAVGSDEEVARLSGIRALLGTIGAAMVFLTRQAQWDKAIEGAIILAAVASDGFSARRRKVVT